MPTLSLLQQGVTGVVGEPHPNLEMGVMKEHRQEQDSQELFTTSNYGITTDPETEFNLVMGGGEGLERKIVTMHDGTQVEHVMVKNTVSFDSRVQTRGPCKQGQVKEDLRVLRPFTDYGTFVSLF